MANEPLSLKGRTVLRFEGVRSSFDGDVIDTCFVFRVDDITV